MALYIVLRKTKCISNRTAKYFLPLYFVTVVQTEKSYPQYFIFPATAASFKSLDLFFTNTDFFVDIVGTKRRTRVALESLE